jgi:stage III sporulation protein AG
MLGFSGLRETVFAADTTANDSITREEDSQGGTRETHQTQQTHQTVIISSQGSSRPLIAQEIVPAIEGIVIIAQGGNDNNVRAALTRAAQAVLGLDAHRIQVLPMRV